MIFCLYILDIAINGGLIMGERGLYYNPLKEILERSC